MKLESGRELNEEFFDVPTKNEVARPDGGRFYRGVDAEGLDAEEFEQFWADLAQKNGDAFRASGTAQPQGTHETAAQAKPEQGEALSQEGYASGMPNESDDAQTAFEADCTRLRKLLNTRIVDREIYRKTLAFCTQMREFTDAEDNIQACPEFAYSDQSPFRYISTLVAEGGLAQHDLDEDGNVIDPAAFEGLTEDEADDLVFSYGLETTEAGRAVADELAPRQRLRQVLATFPDRSGIYQELLSFIKDNHCKYEQVQQLFAGRDFSHLKTFSTQPHINLQPSVFLDNMEKAGGIVWDKGGWVLTPDGEAFLAQLMQETAQ